MSDRSAPALSERAPLHALTGLVAGVPSVAAALEQAGPDGTAALDLTAPSALRPLLASALSRRTSTDAVDDDGDASRRRPPVVLVVTATARETDEIAAAARSLVGNDAVVSYPAWETLPHERLSPRSDTVGRRLAVLRRLVHPGEDGTTAEPVRIVVAPVRSVLQPQVKGLADLEPVALRDGDEVELDDVVRRLAAAAYHRVDMVERRGEFAVRGGIVDVFPPTDEHPVRVEFWGDTVEEIRSFAVADQRSLERRPSCGPHRAASCCSPTTSGLVPASCPLTTRSCTRCSTSSPRVTRSRGWSPWHRHSSTTWSCWSTCFRWTRWFWSATPSGSGHGHTTWSPPARSSSRRRGRPRPAVERRRSTWAQRRTGPSATSGPTRWRGAQRGGRCRPFGLGRGGRAARRGCGRLRTETGEIVEVDVDVRGTVETRALDVTAAEAYRGDTTAAVADIATVGEAGSPRRARDRRTRSGSAAGRGADGARRRRASGRAARRGGTDGSGRGRPGEPEPRVRRRGAPPHGLVVLTGDDLTSQRTTAKDTQRMPSRRRKQIDPLELRTGDYVVHEQHGVGRYLEMIQRTVAGATREYLLIEYAASKRGHPADRLFVPTDQLDQVTRYVGGEQPSLDRLGGSDWNKRKGRARKAVRQIAAELIKLYAARQATKGHAFGPDTPWQRELEDAFPYVETPDQLASVDEVKRDMEQSGPDGPAHLRRRRVRQDRDRRPCGVQGHPGRQAGCGARAHDTARAAAQPDVRGAVRRLPGDRQAVEPFPDRPRGRTGDRGPEGRHGRPGHRHASAVQRRGEGQGPRPGDRRRGAALRRRTQGSAEADAHGGRRAQHVRHPDPAHARDGDHRHSRDVDDHDAAGGAAPGADVRRQLRRRPGDGRDPARAAA